MLNRLSRETLKQLGRELEFLERLERKEKKHLEEGDWYP